MKSISEKLTTRKAKIALISTACVVLLGIFCGTWAVKAEQREITVSIDGKEASYTTYKHTVAEFLADENIILGKNDTINVDLNTPLDDNAAISIERAKEVEIVVDGETLHLSAMDISVAEALTQANVDIDEDDRVTPDKDTPLTLGMVIHVDRIEVKEEVRETEIGYSVEKRRDSSMSIYDEKVLQEGSVGTKTDTYRVTYCNGEVEDEVLLSSQREEPVSRIVVTGSYDVASRGGNQSEAIDSASEPAATQSSGDTTAATGYAPNGMTYTSTLTVKATAYTHDGSKTKMGTECRVGAIAVDPSVIPLGTKLYVEGYGYCTAEDTGGKIKGNRIDVFLDTESECNTWGVKTVKVYILE